MLSRFALNPAYTGFGRMLVTRASSSVAPAASTAVARPPGKLDDYVDPWQNPERDYVNFPHPVQPKELPPLRHIAIPESYFQFFYEKTGVTGPYLFALLVPGLFLHSKELGIVYDPLIFPKYFAYGSFYALVYYNVRKFYIAHSIKMEADIDKHYADFRQGEISGFIADVEAEQNAQNVSTSFEEIIEVKKNSVGLQLEAEHRNRLNEAYDQIKKRLDYQLELSNIKKRAEQKHMVNWIISNVRKSITAKQEDEALKKCIADLKAMSSVAK